VLHVRSGSSAFEDSSGSGVGETAVVRVDPERLRDELLAAAADAAVDPATLVVWVVDAARPPGTTPLAYLQPAGFVELDTVRVFRAVGAARALEHRLRAHRLAVWAELSGTPAWALGPMLRHELEHARRWERSGPRFFEADDLLRAAVRAAGGDGYGALPSELEANAASAAYASRMLTGTQLAELRGSEELWSLLSTDPPPADVVEATLIELARRDGVPDSAYIESVRASCAAWKPEPARLVAGRSGPEITVIP
jgi:hypothetical protein